MGSVTLGQVWIAPTSDLTAGISAYSGGFAPMSSTSAAMTRGTDMRSGRGQVRTYANGRVRNVVAAGISRSFAMTLQMVTTAQMFTLESWINQTVLYRDTRGRKIYGVFNGLQVYDYKGTDWHDVTLTVTEVTFSEDGATVPTSVMDGGAPTDSGTGIIDGGTP